MYRDQHIGPDGANGYRFTWRGSAFNCIWFDVLAPDGARGEIEIRTCLGDYEGSIYNGGIDAYRRECGPLVNVLRWSDCTRPMSEEMRAAFNAWQIAANESALAFMLARPERYGAPDEIRQHMGAPLLARDGAHYTGAHGWRFNSAAALAP